MSEDMQSRSLRGAVFALCHEARYHLLETAEIFNQVQQVMKLGFAVPRFIQIYKHCMVFDDQVMQFIHVLHCVVCPHCQQTNDMRQKYEATYMTKQGVTILEMWLHAIGQKASQTASTAISRSLKTRS